MGELSKLNNATIRSYFDKKINHEICALRFWKRKLDVNIEDYFTLASECSKETRLRLLHFKFIHNIYPTNILLKKMDIATSNQCLWCSETDYIEQAFYNCRQLELFWKNVKQLILAKYNCRIPLNETTALFGVTKTDISNLRTRREVNHLLLIAKLSISKFKYGQCKNLNAIFEAEVRMRIPGFHEAM